MTSSVQLVTTRALLLDIEGTTTPLDFVYSVLFPYARERTQQFLVSHLSNREVLADLADLAKQYQEDRIEGLNPPPFSDIITVDQVDKVVSYVDWLIDSDRKVTPLKSLQGKIWEDGYRTGELRGQVFSDVPRAFKRWQQEKKSISIFSSGSVLAQKLLFSNTDHGDLTPFISQYFDTNIGHKTSDRSYVSIAERLRLECSVILFISDILAELMAAKSAGMQTILCVRPGNQPQESLGWNTITSFDELSG